MKLSCMALTAPQEAAVVITAKSADSRRAEADLLAFHVAAGRSTPSACDQRVAGRFSAQ
jgi:hypothetical protein